MHDELIPRPTSILDVSLVEARERLSPDKAKFALADAMGCVIKMADWDVSMETKTKYVESCVLAFANGAYWEMFWTCMGNAFTYDFRAFVMDWKMAVQAKPNTSRSGEPDWNIVDPQYDDRAIETVEAAILDLKAYFRSLNTSYLEEYSEVLFQDIYELGCAAISVFRGGKSLREILDTIKDLS